MFPARLHSARNLEARRLIEPVDSLGDGRNSRTIRCEGPLEHEYRYSQRTGRRNFAVGGCSAAVLGHDGVDGIGSQQCLIGGFAERAAPENVSCVRHAERWINWVNTSYEVMMLGSAAERTQLLTSDGKENASRAAAECPHGSFRVGDLDPEISVQRLPGRAAQTEDGSAGSSGCQCRVGGDRVSVGMGGVYQKVNVVGLQIRREPLSASESADSYGSRLRCRRRRAACQRNRCGKRASRQSSGELASFGRSSQNQDVRLHVRQH